MIDEMLQRGRVDDTVYDSVVLVVRKTALSK